MYFLESEVATEEERVEVLCALEARSLSEIRLLFERHEGFYLIATGAPRLVGPGTRVAEALLLSYLHEPTPEREMRKLLLRMAVRPNSPLLTPRVVEAAIEAVHHPQAPTEARDLALSLLADADALPICAHDNKERLFNAVARIRGKWALSQLEAIVARIEDPAFKNWQVEKDRAMAPADA